MLKRSRKKENLSYKEVLKDLNLTEDTLSLLENLVKGNKEVLEDDKGSEEVLKRLQDTGVNNIEINLLTTLTENLKELLHKIGGIDNFVKISLTYWVKQKLSNSLNELNDLKNKMTEVKSELLKKEQELEEQKHLVESKGQTIEILNESISNLNEKLSEVLITKDTLVPGSDFTSPNIIYASEIQTKKRASELKKENIELVEKLKLAEARVIQVEQEAKAHYKEAIAKLQQKIQNTVGEKQKEWEEFYAKLNEQRRVEILTLQESHEKKIFEYEQKINELYNQFGSNENSVLGFLKGIVGKINDSL